MTMNKNDKKIMLAHGGGGQLSDDLIRNTILARISPKAEKLGDSAVIETNGGSLCFTTDSYVVKPLFFSGGDIGKLAVCGTVNDLAVAGAIPMALSLALIIESGFEISTLERILDSIALEAQKLNVRIVTGDTKTVEEGEADGIFINTSGIGFRPASVHPGFDRISPGDKIILSGTIGDHGMTIISQRKGIKFSSPLASDCAGLSPLISKIQEHCPEVKFMRDPTRGGLAASLNEISRETGLSVTIEQDHIPVSPTVQAAADALGFDVLNIANEGKFIAVAAPDSVDKLMDICTSHELGKKAAVIGEIISESGRPAVEMVTSIGGKRIVQMPYGRELPRIC